MTNPTQRFFMVKVTGCKDCPNSQQSSYMSAAKVCILAVYKDAAGIHSKNFEVVTSSCPMWAQSQEVEK